MLRKGESTPLFSVSFVAFVCRKIAVAFTYIRVCFGKVRISIYVNLIVLMLALCNWNLYNVLSPMFCVEPKCIFSFIYFCLPLLRRA